MSDETPGRFAFGLDLRNPFVVTGWCLILELICVALYGFLVQDSHGGFFKALWGCFYSHISIDLLTIWLALSGISYAFIHYRELKSQTEELRWLQRSLSTRRIAQFPMYLLEIAKLAKVARREANKQAKLASRAGMTVESIDWSERWTVHLDILADCLDYGSFFAPDFHARVHRALCRAANTPGVRVRLLVCAEMPEPFTGTSGQTLADYPNGKQLLEDYRIALRGDPGFMSWIKRLNLSDSVWKQVARSWFKSLIADQEQMPAWTELIEKDYEQMVRPGEKSLKQLLQIRQIWFAKDLQRVKVEIADLTEREPIFFWIRYKHGGREPYELKKRDSRDAALFTFANARAGEGQLGFSTRDHDLLNTFRAIFERKWALAQQMEHEWLKVLKTVDTFGGVPESSPPILTASQSK